MNIIYFVTSNNGKLIEAKEKFSEVDIDIVQHNIGYPEIQANNLEDVARYGLEYLKYKIDGPYIIEDAGLFIDSLDGFPGVYSSYVYHTIGCKGILKLMEKTKGNNRRAIFKSVFAYMGNDGKSRYFVGECIGKISDKEIGENGFGYDPIFIPEGEKRTFAEIDINKKNNFSHRGKSLEKLFDFLKKQQIYKFKSK